MALSATSSAAVWAAVEAAREAGVTVSFDPNLGRKLWDGDVAAAALEPLARHADLVHVGLDEGEVLTGRRGREAVADWYLERGASLVTIKQGADGAWAIDGESSWSAETFPVTAVDAVGAGDAFAAGFLAGRLRDEPVDVCLRLASTAGALAVQVPGDIEGLPYARDVEALLAAGPDVDR
jgi:2-dehydro-3-deoxygluconokinase